jgi:hypothetical protein
MVKNDNTYEELMSTDVNDSKVKIDWSLLSIIYFHNKFLIINLILYQYW